MAGDNDLFGDSSSDADTDDLIAAAKSQPIARKKDGAASKPKAAKTDAPDADNDLSDSDSEDAGLFDSSSDEEGPKAKKLGKKRKAAKKKKPAKKDTRSMKERMEALAKKRAGEGGEGREPRKKRSKKSQEGEKEGEKGEGYDSGDSYDSDTFERTKEDDDFIDADDDPDALKELYSEQKFDDERPDGYDSEEEKKAKQKKSASRKSSGGGLDKISLSDDEGTPNATSALKEAVKRMQKKKKEKVNLQDLEVKGTEFLKKMDAAADADEESIANKRPGMKKLAMLQKVMDTLAKKDLQRVLLDLDLLSMCKRWIQPLPNGTLGNVTVRRRIVESIAGMSGENGVNSTDLKRSGFGKVVMTLYMHKDETPDMKKMLKSTIEQWSRPIFQKSGNMRDLERAQAARAYNEGGSLVGLARDRAAEEKREERRRSGGAARGKTEDDLAQIISEGTKSATDAGNNRVRVPFSKGFQYTVRPEDKRGFVGDTRNLASAKAAMGGADREDRRSQLEKKMVNRSKKRNKLSGNISIEGRPVK
ncbi:hypothetical protein ACHAXT_012623 [Thalassiosira profunda]